MSDPSAVIGPKKAMRTAHEPLRRREGLGQKEGREGRRKQRLWDVRMRQWGFWEGTRVCVVGMGFIGSSRHVRNKMRGEGSSLGRSYKYIHMDTGTAR